MPIYRLLRKLGLRADRPPPVRDPFQTKLHQHLQRLGSERVEYLAAVAGQLTRVAHADEAISDAEATSIARLLKEHAELTSAEARLVVDMVRHQFEVLKGMQPYLLNRAVNQYATQTAKEHLIDSLYAVAAADHLVSNVEELEIRRIAAALLVSHKTLMDIRRRYKDHLEVMKLVKRPARSRST